MGLSLSARLAPVALLAAAALGGATVAVAAPSPATSTERSPGKPTKPGKPTRPGKPTPPGTPTLTGRAILPATAYQAGPASGFQVTGDLNGVTIPFGGQPIPGFSAVLSLGRGRFLGMPDNGFGAKTNSADFELRAYVIRPDFRSGDVAVERFIALRDPRRKVPFALTRADRVLTGADFDPESVRIARDGTLWFGEEFGPFLLHTDRRGVVLDAPVPLPGVQSPQNPALTDPAAATQPASGGFEAMAASPDGRFLYPALEKAMIGAPDPRVRIIHEFDTRTRRYTNRTWTYKTDAAVPDGLLGDMVALDRDRWLVIERDDAQGVEAVQKKLYVVDRRRVGPDGALVKRLAVDLLDIADPDGVSTPARPGEYGVGDPFRFPLQSVESVEVIGRDRILVANDNNFPGSDGRWLARDRPDDTELITLRVPGL